MRRSDVLVALRNEFENTLGCCLHNPQFTPDDVRDVLYYDQYLGQYSDYSTTLIVSLYSGGFGLYVASADYTGHGCQCDSMTVTSSTIHGLLGHMTEHEVIALLAEPTNDSVDW